MRWMVVGHGGIVSAFAAAISALPNHEIAVVVGRSAQRAGEFAATHGIANATGEMVPFLDSVDAVYVGTPHPAHALAVEQALEAGVPVLCEKPMTLSSSSTAALVDLARSRGTFLMEAVWTRFMPTYDHVFRWLDAGAIGTPRGIKAAFGFSRPFDRSHRLFSPELGGGALYDIGIYPLHVSQWLFGEPLQLFGSGSVGESGVDEYVSINGTYPEGVHADLCATTRIALDSTAIIWGDEGWIELPKFWMPQEATLRAAGSDQHVAEPFDVNGYEYEIREMERCLGDGLVESPAMPWSASLAIASQVDDLLEQVHGQSSSPS